MLSEHLLRNCLKNFTFRIRALNVPWGSRKFSISAVWVWTWALCVWNLCFLFSSGAHRSVRGHWKILSCLKRCESWFFFGGDGGLFSHIFHFCLLRENHWKTFSSKETLMTGIHVLANFMGFSEILSQYQGTILWLCTDGKADACVHEDSLLKCWSSCCQAIGSYSLSVMLELWEVTMHQPVCTPRKGKLNIQ